MEVTNHWAMAVLVVGLLTGLWVCHAIYVDTHVPRWHAEHLRQRRAKASAAESAKRDDEATSSQRRLAELLANIEPPVKLQPGQIHQPSPQRVLALRSAIQAQAFVHTHIVPHSPRRKSCVSRVLGK